MSEDTMADTERVSIYRAAISIATSMASEVFSRADLASLRRMDPCGLPPPAFWRLAVARGLLTSGPVREENWAHAMRAMAHYDAQRVAGHSRSRR